MQLPTSRRTFIKQSTLGALALGMPSLGPEWRLKPGNNMNIGLVTYLWGKDMALPELIAACAAAKMGAVELRTEHAHGVEPDIPKATRDRVKKMFEDSPVTCLGPGTNQAYHYNDPKQVRDNIEGTKAFIKLSHDIGGTGVKVKPNGLPEGVPKEKTIEQIGRSLNEVGKFAADYGQVIRVEVHGRDTQELPAMKAIMDVADNPHVTVCWNCNPNDLHGEGLVHNFNLVKDRFGDTVHVREFHVGDYPYQELFDLFVGIDYEGWILLECRTDPADKVAAMQEQRKLWKKMIKTAQKNLP